jgi:hypothetical protein
MSKKMMLLALAVVSAVIFVLPAAASANWGVTPGNAEFSGSGPDGSLFASGEPTIRCAGTTTASGKYDGSGTTGHIHLHFTLCTTTVIFRFPCSTTATPKDEIITVTASFHNVDITENKPGVLVTPEPTVIKCESVGNAITVSGSVLGEVTSPIHTCPINTNTLGLKLGVTGSPATQVHKTIVGSATEYDLSATTAGGSAVTAALNASATNTFTNPKEVMLDCGAP